MNSKLSNQELEDLQSKYPCLPTDYFLYLKETGWGETESGKVIYSGPCSSADIYGDSVNLYSILILGDDMQGYCFGYNIDTQAYGEVSDNGEWEQFSNGEGITSYVR